MSASLVGSEMCIRDSVESERQQTLLQQARQEPRQSRSPRRAAAGAANAVSYTHLTLPTICSV
eukprot:8239604-Alexandrium_andersonii.AAC.1